MFHVLTACVIRYSFYDRHYREIEESPGGFDAFTKKYEYYGFTVHDNTITYREWAPNAVSASLVGEFSKLPHKYQKKKKTSHVNR